MKLFRKFLFTVAVVLVLLALSAGLTDAQGPVGTAFTYQGRLTDGGVPANTGHDFEFKLYPTVVAGTQIGSTYTRNDVNVINGLFVVELDFGVSPYTGQALYLQVGVRPGSSTGAYTTLLPRQELTPSPYSLFASTASFASAPWVTNGSAVTYSQGNVGIGTTAPTSKLEIAAQDGLAITGYQPFLTLRDTNAGNTRSILAGGNGDFGFHPNSFIGGYPAMILKNTTGNLGVGTSAPADKLTVATAGGNFGLVHTDGIAAVGTWVGTGVGAGEAGWFGTKTNHPLRFFVNNTGAAMSIDTANRVGIGTTTPSAPLEVNGSIRAQGLTGGSNLFLDAATGRIGLRSAGNTERMTILSSGYVGIGTTSPSAKLEVIGSSYNSNTTALHVKTSEGSTLLSVNSLGWLAVGAPAPETTTGVCWNNGGGTWALATCHSAAEHVPTIDSGVGFPEIADLVSFVPNVKNPYDDTNAPFVVTKSNKACDPNLLGFIIDPKLGADGKKVNEHYLPLAIYGFFPAKVTLENGLIKRGDPLTSSSKPGYAMKATDACKTIGYALHDANAEGTIQVFANTGETAATEVASLREQVKTQDAQIEELKQQNVEWKQQVVTMQQENVTLEQRISKLEQSQSVNSAVGSSFNLNWLVLGAVALFGVVWVRRGSKEQ